MVCQRTPRALLHSLGAAMRWMFSFSFKSSGTVASRSLELDRLPEGHMRFSQQLIEEFSASCRDETPVRQSTT